MNRSTEAERRGRQGPREAQRLLLRGGAAQPQDTVGGRQASPHLPGPIPNPSPRPPRLSFKLPISPPGPRLTPVTSREQTATLGGLSRENLRGKALVAGEPWDRQSHTQRGQTEAPGTQHREAWEPQLSVKVWCRRSTR